MYLALLNALFLIRYSAQGRRDLARQLYWVVLIGLFLFSAFRFRVGCDWSGYYENYVQGASTTFSSAMQNREPLWWLIQVAFNDWGLPYPAVNVLTSAIFFSGIHALAQRQPDRLAFLVLLFPILIINMPMSGIRQAAAIGFFCLSIIEFVDQRPTRFVIWILLGGMIHSSVLAFLTLTPLTTGRYTNGRILVAVILGVPGAILFGQTDSVQVAIDRYVNNDADAFGSAYRVGMLTLSGLLFFQFLSQNWRRYYPKDAGVASVGAFFMVALLALVPISSVISDRVGYYLVPIQAMFFARIPFLKLAANRLVIAVLPYLGLALAFAVWTLSSSIFEGCYTPYQSWLFGNEDFGKTGF